MFSLPVFHNLLKPNRRFKLKIQSDAPEGVIGPNLSRTDILLHINPHLRVAILKGEQKNALCFTNKMKRTPDFRTQNFTSI